MLGRKDYTREEIDGARRTLTRQLTAYTKLTKAVAATGDAGAMGAMETFEPHFCEAMLLELDRRFVHRLRGSTGKDGNPLNETELLVESLLNNDGELRTGNVVKYVPQDSVTGLKPGDAVRLDLRDVERLVEGFLADIEAKFL
jgi:hypothetical protein